MARVTIALALAIALAACGEADVGYPPAYELNFMRACEAQNPNAGVCACTWARIETNLPRRDLDALERLSAAARARSPLQRQIEGYVRACAAESATP